jgi:hypothetical protein
MFKGGMPSLTLPPISRVARTPNPPSNVRLPVNIDRSATCPGPRNPRLVERFEKCEGSSLPSDASALFADRSVTCPEPRNVRLGRLERLDKTEGARPDLLSKDRSAPYPEPRNPRLDRLERLGRGEKRDVGSEKHDGLPMPTPRAAGGTNGGLAQRMGIEQGSIPRARPPRDDGAKAPREDSAIQARPGRSCQTLCPLRWLVRLFVVTLLLSQGASSKMNQMEHMCRQVDADAEFIRMLEQEMGITLNPLKPQRCAPQRPLPLLCLSASTSGRRMKDSICT